MCERPAAGRWVAMGGAGGGKTALLDHVIAVLDLRVVRAIAVESEMELAFAGVHQVCSPVLDVLERLPAPQRDALEVAFGVQRRRRAGSLPGGFGGVDAASGGGGGATAPVRG